MIRIPLTVSFYKKNSRIYNSYILEYIWIDRCGNLRSKIRTAYPSFESSDSGSENDYIAVENWNHHDDGLKDGEIEIALVPVAHFLNPFFDPGRAFLILCETCFADGTPTETNFRWDATKVFDKGGCKLGPRFRINQEYFIVQPPRFAQGVQEPHYCGVGARTVALRKLAEKHYEYCFQAGLKIGGMNAGVEPSQWEFQIGPCCDISAGDELWVARYILHKLGEEFDVCISFKSKSVRTLNTTFSTEESRNKNGLKCIYKYIDRLSKKYPHDDAGFALGAAASASIRVPKSVLKNNCGYLENRYPQSDADPYRVTAAIFTGAGCGNNKSNKSV
jgi:glutamine synthetase